MFVLVDALFLRNGCVRVRCENGLALTGRGLRFQLLGLFRQHGRLSFQIDFFTVLNVLISLPS